MFYALFLFCVLFFTYNEKLVYSVNISENLPFTPDILYQNYNALWSTIHGLEQVIHEQTQAIANQ